MSTLTALFVFGDEDADTEQLSTVWERFNDRSEGGEWTDHLYDPTLEGYVVGDGPYDRNVRVGKDMIVGELYADGVNERTMGSPDLPFVELRIEEALFERADTDERRAQQADALSDIVRQIYLALDPRPAIIYGMPNDVRTAIVEYQDVPPASRRSLQNGELEYPVWLTVFAPALVESYGRETLLSSPVWRTEEWEDGSIAIITSPDPLLPENSRELHDSLGIEFVW